jgi:hypothetical protein
MNNEHIYARHGDLKFFAEPIPAHIALATPKAPLVLAGRESAPHTISRFQDVEHFADGDVQYLRVKTPVELTHGGRHTTITLEAQDYVIESLAEMRGDLVQAVED